MLNLCFCPLNPGLVEHPGSAFDETLKKTGATRDAESRRCFGTRGFLLQDGILVLRRCVGWRVHIGAGSPVEVVRFIERE